MEQPIPDPAVFAHVRIVLSIVVSLGMARLLAGMARFVQHPGRMRVYWIHLFWGLSLLLTMMHFWWWEFALSRVTQWRVEVYFFVISYGALYYFLCAVLFPDDIGEYAGWRDYFLSRRAWFFGLLGLVYAVDIFDTWIKGATYFGAEGIEYPIRIGAYMLLCAVAAMTANERFHGAFVLANLIYQVSWILRKYDVIDAKFY